MSDTSRGRVTITLGRSGQVVKRDLSASGASFSSSVPTAGIKRSVRDRIGHNADSSLWHEDDHSNNKRQRGDISMRSRLDGKGRIDKDDLRLKLMRKSALRRTEGNGNTKRLMDLREKLSTAVQHPVASSSLKQQMSDRETSMLGRISSARSSDDLMRMENMRSSYSPWSSNHMRQRSPDGFPGTSRGISPQSNVKDLQRRPLSRAYDSARPVPYVTRDALENSRPPSAAPASLMSHSTVSTVPSITVKPIAPQLGQLPPPRIAAAAQRTSYMESEQQTPQTVDGLLNALGLGKYAILFKAEEVDMAALKQMGENDLKELGIPMGPRKKILLALLPRAKRQQ
ncbi:uncharacterized protein LOC114757017 isoform X1 [Neltuma alba]|uniref:uncharacterized protein LOC114757017 isoform X1 n=1 Tax=Neltuma alba TaxID=207710 RepID=UPI0010A39777|nr:uncharacterized protein LOC114757017 isoform X1 [Prosopis alba]